MHKSVGDHVKSLYNFVLF